MGEPDLDHDVPDRRLGREEVEGFIDKQANRTLHVHISSHPAFFMLLTG